MTQTEELSLTTLGTIEEPPPAPQRSGGKNGWWWPLALGALVCILVGAAAGYLLAPDDDQEPLSVPAPPRPAQVLAPGSLLGPIGGSTPAESTDGTARYSYAWPGQELEAPLSSTGDIVGYQWELCDVPPEPDTEGAPTERVALECAPVDGATGEHFTSPPTDRTRLIRAVVTVDLGNDALVEALTVPVAALAWPESVEPGEPPPAARPISPAVSR